MRSEKRLVKGLNTAGQPAMTRLQAHQFGERNMPTDLKKAGFECIVAASDPELHGGIWYRINYALATRRKT